MKCSEILQCCVDLSNIIRSLLEFNKQYDVANYIFFGFYFLYNYIRLYSCLIL